MPLHDERGNALGRVVVIRDLRELEEMRRRMLIQARLAAVGELVAGLAHEMNNPLAFVRSNLALLESHTKALDDFGSLTPDERNEIVRESRELVGESLTGVDRATEIVRGVRRFTQTGRFERVQASLNELVEDAIAMLRPRARPLDVVLDIRLAATPELSCAPHELRQVFFVLLANALDEVGERGRISVSTRTEDDTVLVEIADDGRGMSPETIERIFDPFFSTKGVGEGTGLGLGVAWNVVHAHGGQIDVESAPDAGSLFRVRFPASSTGRD
jgi:signal transduction histidine kinase